MTGLMIFGIFTLSVAVLGAYTIVAPWWRSRAGRAYFVLFCALAFLAGHFLIEELAGQSPQWWEDTVLGAVAAAIGWNLYTIVSKQLHYWRLERPSAPEPPSDPMI
jgi:uncharacterized BrkB/YihY/UPF0761 family membrane protein